ncbi:MAG: hypothetical protein ACE5FH_09060 [Candidatus Zixiibacteriota bacterium]
MLKLTAFVISTALFCPTNISADDDILGQVLGEVGFTRADLGYRPAGYWNRFPLDVPYRLTSFDALFAEPLKLYDYSMVMANAVEIYLNPTYADSADDGLYKLVYNLGVDKKLGGFRSYSANLLPAPDNDHALETAIERLFALGERAVDVYSFGSKSETPDPRDVVREKTSKLPDTVRTVMATLIVNLTEAIKWRNLAFRNCGDEDMRRAFEIRDLAQTQGDGQIYYPELDDIAASIDWPSLHYAALKTAAATERAERALKPLAGQIPDDFSLELATPFGTIAMFSPTNKTKAAGSVGELFSSLKPSIPGWFEYDASNTLCVIDFGRNSIWQGTPGATFSLSNPISILIDLGGDDYYGYDRTAYQPSSGVGLMGVGIVLDSDGDDHYNGSVYAQGAGLFGVGVLLDRKGNDSYKGTESVQGCGYFGIGLCVDAEGDDEYYLYGDGQGLGGVGGGVGVCASYSGNDKYTAEPYSDVYNRGDYHSEHKINGNTAQGAGFGRRGDGSDGHAWAGGLGAIIDIHGDDHYLSGNWTLGVGYWFGTGIAIDRTGNDIYESCYFTQASGAHYCNGILVDEDGDDVHKLYETAGAGLGFGWDYTNAILINIGGNDSYRAKIISMGLAQIRSNAFLIDIGGDDSYQLGKGTAGLGEATYRTDYDHPSKLTPYYTYAKSFGGFIDIGGADRYVRFDSTGNTLWTTGGDNSIWLQPARSDSTFGADNFGVGIDVDSGTVPELFRWER